MIKIEFLKKFNLMKKCFWQVTQKLDEYLKLNMNIY